MCGGGLVPPPGEALYSGLSIVSATFRRSTLELHSKNSINPVQNKLNRTLGSGLFFVSLLNKSIEVDVFFFVKLHGLKPLLGDYGYIHKELDEVGVEQRGGGKSSRKVRNSLRWILKESRQGGFRARKGRMALFFTDYQSEEVPFRLKYVTTGF